MVHTFKGYGVDGYGDLVVDGVRHPVRVRSSTDGSWFTMVRREDDWALVVDGAVDVASALAATARVLARPAPSHGGGPLTVATPHLDRMADEVRRLQDGVAILEQVWADVGSYNERKVTQETHRALAVYFDSDDSE